MVKALYAALALIIGFVVYGALRPATTRTEITPPPAEVAATGPTLPEDILRVPPAMQAMSGIAPDPGHGVWFMPYAITNEEQGIAMLQAIRREVAAGNGFPERLEVPEGQGAAGRNLLYPAEPGVSRYYISDINNPAATAAAESRMPLVISQPHDGESSADVLFIDGHMETIPLGKFPLTRRFLAALSALDTPEHEE